MSRSRAKIRTTPMRTDGAPTDWLLCDADGNLFGSEEPAFSASAGVTNEFLESIGASRRYEAEELRLATTGMNFRSTARALAEAEGIEISDEELERWVGLERDRVTEHLRTALAPDRAVTGPLTRLAERFSLAVVTSSALKRLAASLEAAELAAFFAEPVRFSAEDSLAAPASKPDPAIYEHACRVLGCADGGAVAVEDSVPGVQSAIAAGIPVIGNVMYVAPKESEERTAALREAGAGHVASSWLEVEQILCGREALSPVPVAAGR